MSIMFRKILELFFNRKVRIVRTEQLCELQIFQQKKPNAQVVSSTGWSTQTAATTCTLQNDMSIMLPISSPTSL